MTATPTVTPLPTITTPTTTTPTPAAETSSSYQTFSLISSISGSMAGLGSAVAGGVSAQKQGEAGMVRLNAEAKKESDRFRIQQEASGTVWDMKNARKALESKTEAANTISSITTSLHSASGGQRSARSYGNPTS